MSSLLPDLVKIQVLSSGTGPFQLGAAATGFRGIEALVDGGGYSYSVQSGSQYEVGTCVWNAGSGLLIRTPLLSSNGNAAVAFGANVEVKFVALGQDLTPAGSLPIVQTPGSATNVAMSQNATTVGLDSKAPNTLATPTAPGLMSITDKIKTDGIVDMKALGAVFDGSYDNAPIFADAIGELPKGGIIRHGHYGNLYTSDNISLPPNIQYTGEWFPQKPRTSWNYLDTTPSCIILEPTKTIQAAGSLLKNVLVWQADIVQNPATEAAFYVELAKYAGTAWTATGDDASVQDCMFIGFNKAMYVNNFLRPTITGNIFDCNNGIEVTACGDFRGADISNNLGQAVYIQSRPWPWAVTIRPGTAVYLHDTVDFLTCWGNKSYGYMTGLHLKNVSSIHASHTSDGPGAQTPEAAAAFAGSRGVHIEGIISNSKIMGCHVDGYDFGYAFDNSAGYPMQAGINTVGSCITSQLVFGANSSGDFGQMQLAGSCDTPLNFTAGIGYWKGDVTSYATASSGNMIYMADLANDVNKIRAIARRQVGASFISDTIGSLWRSTFATLPGTAGKPPVREGDRAIVTDSTTTTYGAAIAGGGGSSVRAIYFNGAWVVGG